MEGLIVEILRYFPQNWGLKSNVTFWVLWFWLCINTNTKKHLSTVILIMIRNKKKKQIKLNQI